VCVTFCYYSSPYEVNDVAVGQQYEFDHDVRPSSQLLVDLQPVHVMANGDGPDTRVEFRDALYT
jgi:hypothetical protein